MFLTTMERGHYRIEVLTVTKQQGPKQIVSWLMADDLSQFSMEEAEATVEESASTRMIALGKVVLV